MTTNLQKWLEIAPELERIANLAYEGSDETCIDGPGVCPNSLDVFRAFEYFDPSETRVVILGQDPYHSVITASDPSPGVPDQVPTIYKASGLAFGYNRNYKGPLDSSLENILREVFMTTVNPTGTLDEIFQESLKQVNKLGTSLESWARQGVLLLNTRLTVEQGKPMSHAGIGWEQPVTDILKFLYRETDTVFMLWGAEARNTFSNAIGEPASETDRVLITSHPCKFSAHRGFIGCNHFNRANEYLRGKGREEIQWIWQT